MKTNRRRPSGSNGSGDVGEGESEGHDPVWNNASSPDSNDERNGANVDILKSNPRQTTCRGKVNTDYLKRAELHDSMDFGTKDEVFSFY